MKVDGQARKKGQSSAKNNGEVDPVIKINYNKILTIEERDLKWHGYERLPQMMTFSNTSSSILISGRWSKRKPFITGGPLGGSYVFSQIHFHLPSEHEIDGERFPLEMHAVHYKSTYSSQDKAMLEKDGTLVIVYLFQLSEIGSSFLHEIIRLIPQLKVVNARITVDPKPLETILTPFNSNYLLYWGSIFSTQSSYMLQWIICLTQLPVSAQQLKDLQQVLYFEKSNWLVAQRLPPEENKIFHIIQYESRHPHVEEMIYHATTVGRKSVSNIALFDSKELGGTLSPLRDVNLAATSAGSYAPYLQDGHISNTLPSQASLAQDSIWADSTTTQYSISPSLRAQASFERESDDGSMQDGNANIEPIEPLESVEPTEVIEPVESIEPAELVQPTKSFTLFKPMEPMESVKQLEPVEPNTPTEQMEPLKPVKPIEPDKPIEQVEPDKPVEPLEPVKPIEPVEPVKPVEPIKPAEPVKALEEQTTTIQDNTDFDKEYEIQIEETTDATDEIKPTNVFMVTNTNSETPMQRAKTPDDRRPSIYGSSEQDFPAKKNSSQQSGLSGGSVGKRSSQQSGISTGSVGKRLSQQAVPAGKRSSLQEASTLRIKSSQQDAHVSRRNSSQEPPSNKKFSSQVPVPVRRHSSVEPPSIRQRPSFQDTLLPAKKSSQQEATTIGKKVSLEKTLPAGMKSPSARITPLVSKKPSLEQTLPGGLKSPVRRTPPASKKPSSEQTSLGGMKSPTGRKTPPTSKKTSLERMSTPNAKPPSASKKPSQEQAPVIGSKLPVATRKPSLEKTPNVKPQTAKTSTVSKKPSQERASLAVKSPTSKTAPVTKKPSQERTPSAGAKSPPIKTSTFSRNTSLEQTPRVKSPPLKSQTGSKSASLEQTPTVNVKSPTVKKSQASKSPSLEQTPLTSLKSPPGSKKSSAETAAHSTAAKSSPPTRPSSGGRKSSQERTPPGSKPSSQEKYFSTRKNSSEDKTSPPVKTFSPVKTSSPIKNSPPLETSRMNSKDTNRRVSFTKDDERKPENGSYKMGSDSKARSVDEEMFIGPLRRRNTRLVSQATDHFQDINAIGAQQVFSPQVSVDYQEQFQESEFRILGNDKISKGNLGRFDSQNNEVIKRVVLINGKEKDKSKLDDERYLVGYDKKNIWASLHDKINYKDATDVQDRMERLSIMVPQQYIQTWVMKIGYRRVIDMGEGMVTSKEIAPAEIHFFCDRIEKDIVTGKKILVGKFEEAKAKKRDREPTALLEVEESYVYVSPMKDYICNLVHRDDYSSGSDESFKSHEEMSIPSFDQEFFISSVSEFDETEQETSKIPDSLYQEFSDGLLHKKHKKRVAKISVDFNINPEREKHRCNEDYELPTAVRAFKARYIEIPQVNKTVEPTKNDESSFNNKNEVRDSTVSENISIKNDRKKSEEQKERRESSPAVKNYKVMYIPCLDYFVPTKL